MRFQLEKALEAYEKKNGKVKNVKDFAKKFRVSHTAMYKWKKGEGLNTPETIKKLMDETGLKFEELFTD